MATAIHARVVLPAELDVPPVGLWGRLVRWLLEVPPNPLVWYAPTDWPTDDKSPTTTVIRRLVLVSHDNLRSPEPR